MHAFFFAWITSCQNEISDDNKCMSFTHQPTNINHTNFHKIVSALDSILQENIFKIKNIKKFKITT